MDRKRKKPLKAKILPDHMFFDIVGEAYRVFSYPKPMSIEVCEGCCMDARIEADFFNPPIEELPLHYVQDWFFAAYEPKGVSKATWGYLLPRILEILAVDEDVSIAAKEVSLNRFETGNPEKWSREEWQVLDRFQRVFLQREVERQSDFLDDTICMFRLAGWPLESLLDQVASNPDNKLAHRFWNDWCNNCAPGRESVWITSFWESTDAATVFDFYTSRGIRDRMEALVVADDTVPELAAKASAIVSVIEASASWNSSSDTVR